jgi:multidrug efflux system membrane fusion protein
MGLQNEEGYPHKGTINFVNNQVNSTTGSITMRGIFPNPRLVLPPVVGNSGQAGQPPVAKESPPAPAPHKARRAFPRLLSPGMFVKIRLPIGEPHSARLVIDRAIQSDQGLKYVYVVDSENKAQYRRVETGALQEDGLRVVTGVEADDWVVVGGLQQVRARMEVRTEPTAMPSLGRAGNPEPKKPEAKQAGQPQAKEATNQGSRPAEKTP